MGPEGLVAVAMVTAGGEASQTAGATRGTRGGASGFGEREAEGWTERRKMVVVLHHIMTTHHLESCFHCAPQTEPRRKTKVKLPCGVHGLLESQGVATINPTCAEEANRVSLLSDSEE